MNDLAATLRTWLMRAPRPAALRIYAKDGREFDVEIKQGAAWSDTAISVAALEPERIEANTPEGKLIRATVVADLVRKEETDQTRQATAFQALSSTDPETQRLIAFAEMITRAHDRATDAIQATVGVAFTQMQEICASLAAQATASQHAANELSVAIRNLLIEQGADAAKATDDEPSPLEQMAAHFLSGANAGAATKPEATKPTNGKH